jgi:hypothetical protein
LQTPGYVLIKRALSEQEQDMLWEHTRRIRIVERRPEEKVVLKIKDHRHRRGSDDEKFEFVRKKRSRSKSPGLLMYLAGGRPA